MEKRKHTRVPFEIESTVRYNGAEIQGQVLNMSLQGMFIDIDESIPVGTGVTVKLNLSSGGMARNITLESRIVRSDSGGTGVKIMDLDLDSCLFLKDLMLNRCDEPARILDEFYEFINTNRTVQQ